MHKFGKLFELYLRKLLTSSQEIMFLCSVLRNIKLLLIDNKYSPVPTTRKNPSSTANNIIGNYQKLNFCIPLIGGS